MVPEPVSLNSLTFSLVGPGKVGTSLASWLVACGAHLNRVASRRPDRAEPLAKILGGHVTPISQICSDGDDLLLIAVSDSALEEVAEVLASLDQASVALHTSGRSPGEILAPLRRRGSAIGSLHPLKAFPRDLVDLEDVAGTVFGIDGDLLAKRMAQRVVDAFAGIAIPIPTEARSHYHLAATLAAGGVVTLLASAAELAEANGLDKAVVAGYLELARGALDLAATSESPAKAITGPAARGDHEGFQRQIDEVRTLDPDLADLLEVLAKRTRHHCEDPDESRQELTRT